MITSEDVREELARIAPQRDCDRRAELSALGRWAIDTLDVCHAFAPEHHLVTATESSGKTILAWSSGSMAFVALCNEPSAVAAAVVKRERRRRAERAQGSE